MPPDTRPRIANARMYAVTPGVEALWQQLLERVAQTAGVALRYLPYPAPQPLEALWCREDLGCVFMCGYPIASGLAEVLPLAAPVPAFDWADGRAVYRSDLIVRADSPFQRLEDTFGHTAGWTVAHSHSGFNAFRHHLLPHRRAGGPPLYARMQGGLVTAGRVLEAVRCGEIDVGPLDAYWHALLARHAPERVQGIRVLESTDTAPMPALVAAAGTPPEVVAALREALIAAADAAWFAPFAAPLLLERFCTVGMADYAQTLAWARDAMEAGYPEPA
jgi:ABC-type phosphate/phosphonate transport system substrate-binding protein